MTETILTTKKTGMVVLLSVLAGYIAAILAIILTASFAHRAFPFVIVPCVAWLALGWILLLALRLNAYSTYISLLTSLLALILVVRLQSRETGTALKLPWIMLILALPVMGLSLYLMIEFRKC